MLSAIPRVDRAVARSRVAFDVVFKAVQEAHVALHEEVIWLGDLGGGTL